MNHTRRSVLSRLIGGLVGVASYAPIGLTRPFPYRWRLAIVGRLTAQLVAKVAGYERRAIDNLTYVCPDLTNDQKRQLARSVSDNAGRAMAELFSPAGFTARAHQAQVSGPGLAAIHKAQADGQPILFISGHFGNFNAARVAMIKQGFDMGVFYRPMRNPWFNQRYAAAMADLSTPLFKQSRLGVMQMMSHLKEGGNAAILADVHAHEGAALTFFGKPAMTVLTPAELSIKFKALLVPVWGIRTDGGLGFDIHIEDPIAPSAPTSMMQQFNDRLETQVRARMDQWFWIHRRWKVGGTPPKPA